MLTWLMISSYTHGFRTAQRKRDTPLKGLRLGSPIIQVSTSLTGINYCKLIGSIEFLNLCPWNPFGRFLAVEPSIHAQAVTIFKISEKDYVRLNHNHYHSTQDRRNPTPNGTNTVLLLVCLLFEELVLDSNCGHNSP